MGKDGKLQFVKATKEGKLYIKTSDFFKQEKVQNLVQKLTNSSITLNIESRNNAKKHELEKV